MGSTIQVGLGVSTHLAPAAAASSAMNLQWTELSLRKPVRYPRHSISKPTCETGRLPWVKQGQDLVSSSSDQGLNLGVPCTGSLES